MNQNQIKVTKSANDLMLCDDCQKLGYCKKYGSEAIRLPVGDFAKSQVSPYYFNGSTSINDTMISNWVPIQASGIYAGTPLRKRLQEAHDLFHQQEFEQASYIYLDIFLTRKDCKQAVIGLAASFFFLRRYEEAAGIVANIDDSLYDKMPSRFSELCSQKIIKEKLDADEARMESKILSQNPYLPAILTPKNELALI